VRAREPRLWSIVIGDSAHLAIQPAVAQCLIICDHHPVSRSGLEESLSGIAPGFGIIAHRTGAGRCVFSISSFLVREAQPEARETTLVAVRTRSRGRCRVQPARPSGFGAHLNGYGLLRLRIDHGRMGSFHLHQNVIRLIGRGGCGSCVISGRLLCLTATEGRPWRGRRPM
jgi:hypothetical protein